MDRKYYSGGNKSSKSKSTEAMLRECFDICANCREFIGPDTDFQIFLQDPPVAVCQPCLDEALADMSRGRAA
jgi:hypothetical protein